MPHKNQYLTKCYENCARYNLDNFVLANDYFRIKCQALKRCSGPQAFDCIPSSDTPSLDETTVNITPTMKPQVSLFILLFLEKMSRSCEPVCNLNPLKGHRVQVKAMIQCLQFWCWLNPNNNVWHWPIWLCKMPQVSLPDVRFSNTKEAVYLGSEVSLMIFII